MHRRSSLLVAVTLALGLPAMVLAAPPGTRPIPTDSGDFATCSGSLSGAASGQFTCRVTVTIQGDVAAFRMEVLDAVRGVRTLAPASFDLAMPLRATTYTREALAGGTAVIELDAGQRYTASARRGEVTLSLESAERYKQARNFYVVSGTLVAHLVSDGGERGEVVIEVRF